MQWELTRRRFIQTATAAGISMSSPAWTVLDSFAQDSARSKHHREMPKSDYKRLPGKKTQCNICPLACILKPGET
jgi:hypothetical protein